MLEVVKLALAFEIRVSDLLGILEMKLEDSEPSMNFSVVCFSLASKNSEFIQ